MDNTGISQEGFQTLEQYAPSQNEQLTLFTLQEMAVNNTDYLQKLKDELKTAKEMLSSAYQSNAELAQAEQTLKDVQNTAKSKKAMLGRMPEIIALEDKVREIKGRIKEKQETISSSAVEIYRLTGNSEFEKDGVKYQVVTVAKLKKVQQ